jgi:hypothetical protein
MTKPENLINWAELSRTLAGNRSSITKDRIPISRQKSINQLLAAISKWLKQQEKSD